MNDNFSIEKIIDFLRKRYYLMPLNIHLISDSYSKVYKINADNGKQYALLVNRKNKNEGDIRAEFTILKQLSQINLGVLSVPKPVFPKKYTNLDIKKHYLNGHFIALYEWVDHYSYDGTIEEAKKAFSAYVDLRKGLDKIHRPNELKELALLRGILDEKQFNFEKFIPYLSDTSFGSPRFIGPKAISCFTVGEKI
ncbi:MAG TPA: hypothetical protein EYP59_08260 [Thiotrichaceae bacterium]|nr:hypothetical protein [Thiotrichaceae bacterium]